MEQSVYKVNGEYGVIGQWLKENNVKSVMLVCDRSIGIHKINEYLDSIPRSLGVRVVRFSDFLPNPLYENAVSGTEIFRRENCGAIIAVGGGSAIDVAKCVKLYSSMEGDGRDGSYLKQAAVPNGIPFLAMPTTAGTGSEATRFAVVYYDGIKQSVSDLSCIPGTVLLDPGVLRTLPEYQKKATAMDAFCHAIESYWSVNSTEESKVYSRKALGMITDNLNGYLEGSDEANERMLTAAYTAGKAINISQTTAGHAMCYKITSLFGCAHGHAAILCDRVLYPWMVKESGKCRDPRGELYLRNVLGDIARGMGCDSPEEAAEKINGMFDMLELRIPAASPEQFEILKNSVNPVRLKNHPVELDSDTIDLLYHRILKAL